MTWVRWAVNASRPLPPPSPAVIQFNGLENVLEAKSLLPVSKPAVAEFMELPFFSLPAPLPSLPSLTHGLLVEVGLVGEACGTVAGEYGEMFSYKVSSPSNSVFVHSFQCKECQFTALSSLHLELPGECQSVSVRVSTVGAQGAVTAVGYVAQPSSAEYLSRVQITVTPGMQVIDDTVHNVHRQGLSLTALPIDSSFVATPPEAVLLAVDLPAAPNFAGESASPLRSLEVGTRVTPLPSPHTRRHGGQVPARGPRLPAPCDARVWVVLHVLVHVYDRAH